MAGTKKKAVVTPKRPKKKREKKRDTESPSEERRIVTVGFDDNQYTGYLHTNSLAQRYLEGADSKYTWQSGAKYEGPFLHSEIQGQGKYTWPDGSTYQGDLHNGKRHGFGVFVAADGVTKYEGQWSEGKRHGAGRLVYDADGNSFYQGQWFEGCKHGKGRQVWPSKNTYEGEWQEGRMHGFGTMTWCENAQIEVYTGEWAQNLPQGQGKYIWHAPDCVQGKEMPVQQTNNSFKGSWSQGLRSGYGKFQFANGAKYEGQWTDNIKHGEGRYTFEDGRVYVGEFVSDNMATPSSPEAEATSQALNLGGADNPVRRCVDVGDLAGFCLPKDRPVTDPTELTGYSEPADVFREIYNVLLRHLGDLKKVYARVRRVVQSDGDPWLVYTYQWWILLREVNLLAPDCFLARADRRVRCGPRQHGEAFYEDMPELRPLTPRPVHAPPSHGERGSLSRKASRDGDQGLTHEQEPLLEEDEDEDVGDDEDEELEEEEGEAETEAVEADAAAEDEAEADKKSCTSRHSRNSRQSRMSFARGRDAQGSRRPTLQSLGRQTSSIGPIDFFFEQNKFWRLEDSEAAAKLVDVHSPRASLMFRHFLEALVRIAPVAYPEHQGLESMLKALLRERILPQVDAPFDLDSCRVFELLADRNVVQVLDNFKPKLWELFKENAAGVGVYALPQWAQLLDFEESEGAKPYKRHFARHFGGLQRRVHVQARMDVTIRVKDALHILKHADLLQLGDIQPFLENPTDSMFPDPKPEDPPQPPLSATPDTEREMSSMRDTFAESRPEKTEAQAPATTPTPAPQPPSAASTAPDPRTPTPAESNNTGEDTATPTPVQDLASKAEAIEEFQHLNFKVDFMEVIRILTEVFKKENAKKICWTLDQSFEGLALMDYLETELTFAEFQLLLLRLACSPAEKALHASSLTPHACMEAFLTQVFLPPLQSQYPQEVDVPLPTPPVPDVRTEEKENEEGEEEGEEKEKADGNKPEELEQPPVADPPSFWFGFCDPDNLDAAANAAPRFWPQGYAAEVLDW